MKRLLLASAAVAAASAMAIAPAQAKTYNMKIGMVTINDSNHFSANWMKKEIEAKSNGRIKVGVFPAAQLGKIPRQIEAIQLGTQEVFMIPPGFFIGIDKRFMVTDAPACSKMKIMRPEPLIIPISLMYFHKWSEKRLRCDVYVGLRSNIDCDHEAVQETG